jgi:MFS transporter, AAHS family, 3-hydroxyphenylpropionic acid transporter
MTSEHKSRTLILCFLAALCEGIDLQAAGVAANGIIREFHPGSQLLTYFFSASTLGLMCGAAFGGRLADRIGRKSVLVGSIAVFGFFSLVTAWAWSIESLIWVRLLAGLGLGGTLPNLISLGAESAAEHRRTLTVTIIYAGMPLGGALASLLTMLIAPAQWRWIFILGGVTPLLVAPAIAALLQESRAFRALRAGAALSRRNKAGVSAVIGEGRAGRTLLLWVSFFLALMTLYLLLNWLPTLLVSSGLSKSQSAAAMIAFNIGGCLGAVVMGAQLETRWRQRGVLIAFVGLPLVLLLLAVAPREPALVVPVVFVLGAAVLAAQSTLYAYAPLCYPTRIRGAGVGFAVAAGRFGSMVGPLLGGFLVVGGMSTFRVLTGMLPVVVLGSVCAVLLAWRPPPALGE